MTTFEPHVPYQRLDLYEYMEADAVSSIVSALRVDLHALTTIIDITVTEINPFTFLLELFVGDDHGPNPVGEDYTWTGTVKVEVLKKECYDDTVTDTDVKKRMVKEEIINVLAQNHSSCFFVTANVIPPPADVNKGTVTNTITSEKEIDIG